jgi:hypothetical protein
MKGELCIKKWNVHHNNLHAPFLAGLARSSLPVICLFLRPVST